MTDSFLSNRAKVAILLATFNGENYLETQLSSILLQDHKDWDLYVIDDGSTDGTMIILNSWNQKGQIKEIFQTNRMGASDAFFYLLKNVSGYDAYIFCDQDDVWCSNKISMSLSRLRTNVPAVITSQRIYINEKGLVIGQSRKLRKKTDWKNAIIENSSPGNTIVLNRHGRDLVVERFLISVKHWDHWIYTVIAAFGIVDVIDEALIQYRLHSQNLVGVRNTSKRKSFRLAVKYYILTAQTFTNTFTDQSENEATTFYLKFMEACKTRDVFRRWIKFSKIDMQRQSSLETFVFKFYLIFLISFSDIG